jgi:glycogen debranching enzyme-like protein
VTLKPLLHDLVPVVAAPTMVFSGADGQIRRHGVQGVFHADVRVIAEAVLRLGGHEPSPLGFAPDGAGTVRFVAVARRVGGLRVRRTRRVRPGGCEEEIEIASDADVPITTTVTVDVVRDHTPIEVVRSGSEPPPAEPGTVSVTGDLTWPVTLAPGERVVLRWSATVDDPDAVLLAGPRGHWARPTVHARDRRLERLVGQSLDDLAALRLTTPADDGDTFLGAGAPWYLTLFGRDSLWAAHMMLPLGTELAVETLRVLGRRQGTAVDPATGEAPGKIMHELRRERFALPEQGISLPPVYYGTIDATPLWISLLHDAWRWGHAPADIEALLGNLEAALGWLGGHDGFLAYVDTSGTGLANQGWKDSADAVRFHDGRRAEPPIALAEVQGYAYRAAMDGAALLDAFGRPGGERWRAYATTLAERFRAAFWVHDGRYPALALDRDGRPVDSLTSNIGHLLGTGILTGEEEARVAAALASAEMSGGYGLRTMSAGDGGFAPLSYHCGSIWAHDTAIAAAGLGAGGFAAEAATLIDGLLCAAEAFGFRLPELYAGDARAELSRPMPYPTACRPQAWSAAAAILILRTWLGLDPDVPGGRVRLRPMPGAPVVRGLRIAGHPVDFDGTTLVGLPAGISVSVE